MAAKRTFLRRTLTIPYQGIIRPQHRGGSVNDRMHAGTPSCAQPGSGQQPTSPRSPGQPFALASLGLLAVGGFEMGSTSNRPVDPRFPIPMWLSDQHAFRSRVITCM